MQRKKQFHCGNKSNTDGCPFHQRCVTFTEEGFISISKPQFTLELTSIITLILDRTMESLRIFVVMFK